MGTQKLNYKYTIVAVESKNLSACKKTRRGHFAPACHSILKSLNSFVENDDPNVLGIMRNKIRFLPSQQWIRTPCSMQQIILNQTVKRKIQLVHLLLHFPAISHMNEELFCCYPSSNGYFKSVNVRLRYYTVFPAKTC